MKMKVFTTKEVHEQWNNVWEYDNIEETLKIRKLEFENVIKFMNTNKYQMLNIEDSHLIEHLEEFKTIDFSDYDYIFMPGSNEKYPDYAAVSFLFNKIKSRKIKTKIYYYEVLSTLKIQHIILIYPVLWIKKDKL